MSISLEPMFMNFLLKMSLARRLALIVASALLGVVVIAVLTLTSERRTVMAERQSAVRQTVEIGHGIIAHHHAEATKGLYTMEEAQNRAKAALRALRYSGDEYFFVNDMHPRMVMHAIKPELDGKDLTQNKDPTGKALFVEFVNTVRGSSTGGGFVSYMWPKPGSDQPVEKLSYVKGFEPWGWIIGSGVYIDNVDAALANAYMQTGLQSLLLLAVLLGLGVAVSRSLLTPAKWSGASRPATCRRGCRPSLAIHRACCTPWASCATAWRVWCTACARVPNRWPRPAARSRRATSISASARSVRPRPSSRPRLRWSS
jgi:hypothetical protein